MIVVFEEFLHIVQRFNDSIGKTTGILRKKINLNYCYYVKQETFKHTVFEHAFFEEMWKNSKSSPAIMYETP